MSARAKTLTRQIVVRIPQDLYDRLEADAEANGRTVAQSVRFILERAPGRTQQQMEEAFPIGSTWQRSDDPDEWSVIGTTSTTRGSWADRDAAYRVRLAKGFHTVATRPGIYEQRYTDEIELDGRSDLSEWSRCSP